jgi:hypothetical protein
MLRAEPVAAVGLSPPPPLLVCRAGHCLSCEPHARPSCAGLAIVFLARNCLDVFRSQNRVMPHRGGWTCVAGRTKGERDHPSGPIGTHRDPIGTPSGPHRDPIGTSSLDTSLAVAPAAVACHRVPHGRAARPPVPRVSHVSQNCASTARAPSCCHTSTSVTWCVPRPNVTLAPRLPQPHPCRRHT